MMHIELVLTQIGIGSECSGRCPRSHLVRSTNARQAVAAIQVPIPVEETQGVEVALAGPDFQRVDFAEHDVRGKFRRGVGEMHRYDEALALAALVGPICKARPQGITEVALFGTRGRHGIHGSTVSPEQPEMTQNVLAVFRSWPDDRFTVTGGKRPLEKIAHI